MMQQASKNARLVVKGPEVERIMDGEPLAKKARLSVGRPLTPLAGSSGGAMFTMPTGGVNVTIANGEIQSVQPTIPATAAQPSSTVQPTALIQTTPLVTALNPNASLPQVAVAIPMDPHQPVAMATSPGPAGQSELEPGPMHSSRPADPDSKDSPVEKTSGDGGDPMIEGLVWENGVGTLPGTDMKFRMNEFGAIEMVMEDPEMPSLSPVDRLSPSGAGEKAASPLNDQSCCLNCGKFGPMSAFVCKGKYCTSKCWTTFNERTSLLPPKITPQKQQQPNQTLSSPAKAGAAHKSAMSPGQKSGVTGQKTGGTATKTAAVKEEPSVVGKIMAKKKRPITEVVKNDSKTLTDAADAEVAKTMASGKKKGFSWALYLETEKLTAAPVKCFKTPFPLARNGFKVGMRLEGIDPRNASLYCCLTVAEVRGYRLRLHFDGYPECYDFWENADSPNLFPVGWCEKNDKKLLPPKGFTIETFNWQEYMKSHRTSAAPRSFFQTRNSTSVTPHGFRVGMKLEAIDRKNTSLICVATVADTIGDRIRIHFDGWEDCFDYWVDTSSPYIKPVGFCQENERPLSTPKGYGDISSFTWPDYLRKTRSTPVPARAFKPRPPMPFEAGYRVEVVDKRNPILIRVASVYEVDDYQIKIHFDGWSDIYDYWIDDDCPDVHPPGWCAKTGHPLLPPISPADLAVSPSQGGCPTPGCKGVGHIRGAKYTGHHSAFGCPYSTLNLNKESVLMDRLTAVKVEGSPGSSKQSSPDNNNSQSSTAKSSPAKLAPDITPVKKVKQKPGRPRKKFPPSDVKPFNGISNGPSTLSNGIHESVFQTATLQTPVNKDGALSWEHHAKLLPGIDTIASTEVAKWDMEEVANFVSGLPGCIDHGRAFQEEQIDGEAFLLLDQSDIVKIMNIKLGPALKIYNSIQMFKRNGLET